MEIINIKRDSVLETTDCEYIELPADETAVGYDVRTLPKEALDIIKQRINNAENQNLR